MREVENAFLPSKEIIDPERFSGREIYLRKAYRSLLTDGANIAIVGNRGIGKTSLARQIINISKGDNRILEKFGFRADERLNFLTTYLACGRDIQNVDTLLEKLVTSRDCLNSWAYEIPRARTEVEKLSSVLKTGVGDVGAERSNSASSSNVISSHSMQTIFQNVASLILEAHREHDGLLVVIDEFDQIADPTGFASLVKSLATNTPGLRFCIVGVAQDIENLMKEHGSSDRLFSGSIFSLPSMNKDELVGIIEDAESRIGKLITFSTEAKNQIATLSQGHPYLTHLIGKQSFRHAYDEGLYSAPLDEIYISEILIKIAEEEADPSLEARYKTAVASSPQRESLLKAFASETGKNNELSTLTVYKVARQFGVDNPSQYMGHLVKEAYGAELAKVREKYYRFKDSLFKAYAAARPRIH